MYSLSLTSLIIYLHLTVSTITSMVIIRMRLQLNGVWGPGPAPFCIPYSRETTRPLVVRLKERHTKSHNVVMVKTFISQQRKRFQAEDFKSVIATKIECQENWAGFTLKDERDKRNHHRQKYPSQLQPSSWWYAHLSTSVGLSPPSQSQPDLQQQRTRNLLFLRIWNLLDYFS